MSDFYEIRYGINDNLCNIIQVIVKKSMEKGLFSLYDGINVRMPLSFRSEPVEK